METDNLQKIGEGQEAQAFLYKDKVLKLFKHPESKSKSEAEFNTLKTIYEMGLSSPQVYENVTIDGKPGYTMDFIKGKSCLNLLIQNMTKMKQIAKIFASTQAEINSKIAPETFSKDKDNLTWCISNSKLPKKQIDIGLSLLSKLPNDNHLNHGDYNLANILFSGDSITSKTVAIDWGAAAQGYFVSDIANAFLMIENGAEPPGTNPLIKIVLHFFRSNFSRAYIKAYREIKQFSDKELSDWLLIRAMARLPYCMDDEKPYLLKLINKRCNKANYK